MIIVACWISFFVGFFACALFSINSRDLDE